MGYAILIWEVPLHVAISADLCHLTRKRSDLLEQGMLYLVQVPESDEFPNLFHSSKLFFIVRIVFPLHAKGLLQRLNVPLLILFVDSGGSSYANVSNSLCSTSSLIFMTRVGAGLPDPQPPGQAAGWARLSPSCLQFFI